MITAPLQRTRWQDGPALWRSLLTREPLLIAPNHIVPMYERVRALIDEHCFGAIHADQFSGGRPMLWLRGTHDTSKQYVKHLIADGIKRRNLAMLDGVLQASFPSHSTLSVLVLIVLAIQVLYSIDFALWEKTCHLDSHRIW